MRLNQFYLKNKFTQNTSSEPFSILFSRKEINGYHKHCVTRLATFAQGIQQKKNRTSYVCIWTKKFFCLLFYISLNLLLIRLVMKKICFVAGLAIMQAVAYAQIPDWATTIAPILYNHCTTCHHTGGIAPFSLITYSDAVANAISMRADVLTKKMPPWPPDPDYSHLAHERLLSNSEINAIVNWVTGGTPSGTLSLAPPAPVYSTTGMLPGTPDLVLKIPTYTSAATTTDVYQCFAIPSGLLADRYITAFEAVPGNPAIVHHVLVFADTTGACAALDAASPGPGYPHFGGIGSSSPIMLGGWVPGSVPTVLPSGFGVRIPHGADIVLQIHYPAGTAPQQDSTEVHFFFAPTTASVRNVSIDPLLYHGFNIDRPLVIPANTTQSFYELLPGTYTSAYGDMTLLGVAPHMHLLGKTIKSYGVHPAGDTDQFIRINEWDFHWQGFYQFPRLKKVPAGSALYAEAFYDNTTANPDNPSSPPITVSAGENTTDEMMIVFLTYTQYQPGDENIVVDSAVALNLPVPDYYHGQQLLDACPNPAVDNLIIKCYLDRPDIASVELIDMSGKIVKRLMENVRVNSGYSAITFSVSDVSPGTYTAVLKTTQQILSKQIIIVH